MLSSSSRSRRVGLTLIVRKETREPEKAKLSTVAHSMKGVRRTMTVALLRRAREEGNVNKEC